MRRTLADIAHGTHQPRKFRDGGHVRGPGTGTSDSIHARLSAGEFVLPDDTVRKVGVRRLQDLVHETHDPVPQKGQRHYANGGLVEDESKRPNSFGDAAAASTASAVSHVGGSAPASPVPAPPPTPAPAQAPAPVAAPASSPPAGNSFGDAAAASKDSLVNQIPTGGLKAPAADGSQTSWSNTETGRNLSNIASALPGSLGGAIPAITKTGGAISGGIDAATRLLNAGAGAAAVSAIPGSVSAQTSSAPASPAGAGRGLTNPPSVNPSSPLPASPERSPVGDRVVDVSSSGNVTRNGNSYSGTNVAGDITINGQPPKGGGQISAQNMAAADTLAASQGAGARERLLAAGSPAAPSFQSPLVRNSTNDWAARKQLENLATGASSITNTPEWSRGATTNWRGQQVRGQADQDGKVAAYQAALKSDLALQQAQPGMDQATMRENGNLQREGMQQSGETQRANIRAQRDDAANQIARGRLSLEQIAAGYQNRASDRLDRAQSELEKAKTPEAQRSARDRLMALAGKAPQNEWGLSVTPTTKNADGSTTQGSIYRYNKTTGETARVDEGQGGQVPRVSTKAQFDALPKGATYLGTDGRTYRKPA